VGFLDCKIQSGNESDSSFSSPKQKGVARKTISYKFMSPLFFFLNQVPGKPSPKSTPQDFTLGIRFCLKGEKEGLRLNLSPLTKS
jgi:hypothetical protein